jgi:hypothetical protein
MSMLKEDYIAMHYKRHHTVATKTLCRSSSTRERMSISKEKTLTMPYTWHRRVATGRFITLEGQGADNGSIKAVTSVGTENLCHQDLVSIVGE